MATSSVILDIRANTNRALADFKRFSAQLDNKFLISGLKLDVVRSALGQINREFQKAIGEQGLTAGQSLRAAQNQASLLLQTFKGFGDEASASISESFSSTFNQIAVTAGGTFDDVKKSLAATPWISTNLPKEIREKLGAGVLEFQRDARRAGLGEDFAGMARQFLMGQVNAGDLLQSGDPLKSEIGKRLQQAGGGPSTIVDAAQRSRVLLDVLSDPKFRDQIAKAAKGAAGFRIILEDLSSTLFNPEKGIFGAVRKVTMAVGDTTTILDETQKLIESIFGKQGTFVLFFEQIKKIFGLEDPLKTVISGIRWLTTQFNRLNTFLQSPQVQQIVGILRTAFTNIQNFVTKLSESITSLQDPEEDWDPSKISQSIRDVGKSVRDFIKKIGEEIRSIDVDKQGNFFLEIFKTIVGEIAQTLGTAINEAILTIFSGKGLAVLGGVISVLYEGLSKFFTGLFGGNQLLGGLAGGLATGAVTLAFGKKIALALGGLASRIVKAVPGAGLLIRPISGALGALGRRIATQLRKIPGIKRLIPNVTEPTSTLGTAQTFQRQVVSYLQQIASCVCGPGGLGNRGGPGLDRARNDRLGRNRVSDLGYSGPSRRVALRSDGPLEIQPPRRRFGDRVRGFGRGIRGFGKGALLLGAGAAILNAGGAFAGQEPQGEYDPATDSFIEPAQKQMGGGEAFGAIGAKAGEFAMIGSFLGPKGAAIGAAIGAGVALLDKEVRDGAIKASLSWSKGVLSTVTDWAKSVASTVVDWSKTLRDGAGSLVQTLFKVFTVDLPGLLLKGLKRLYIDIPLKILAFSTELGKSLVDSVAKFDLGEALKNTWDNIKSFVTGSRPAAAAAGGRRRAVGGNVYEGESYLVGERGIEWFTPTTNGNITNNATLNNLSSRASSPTSTSATFNITITVNGNMGAGNVEELRGPVLAIIKQAWEEASTGIATRGSVI